MKLHLFSFLLLGASFLHAQFTAPPAAVGSTVDATQAIPLESAGEKLPWSPQQATGAPDTPRPGDFATAWAASAVDARPEWLMVEFAEPATLDSIRIYESFNPGAISGVTAFAADGREVPLVPGRATPGEWTSEYRAPASGAI